MNGYGYLSASMLKALDRAVKSVFDDAFQNGCDLDSLDIISKALQIVQLRSYHFWDENEISDATRYLKTEWNVVEVTTKTKG